MTAIENTETLFNQGLRKVTAIFPDGGKTTLRLFKSSNQICCFSKGSKKYGNPISYLYPQPIQILPIVSRKSNQAKWEDGWKKVRAKLVQSSLWPILITEIDLALSIGYDKLNQAYKDYWDSLNNEEAFIQKYPELTYTNSEGKTCINTTVVWRYAKFPVVKKMRFTKFASDNDRILRQIQEAMTNKKDYSVDGRTSYDVSFQYDAEKQKAWYSLEYKGCGNGWYYLALNANHAMFYEKD